MYLSDYFYKILLLAYFVLLSKTVSGYPAEVFYSHSAEGDGLYYTRGKLVALNIGIGTPTPLKHIQYNWATQANFQLPWKSSQIPTNILYANSGYDGESRRLKRNQNLNKESEEFEHGKEFKLHHLYNYIGEVLTGYGYEGTLCIRQALCQLAVEPIQPPDDEDLLYEITELLLNPKNDITDTNVSMDSEEWEFMKAFDHGIESGTCDDKYDGCSISLLDMFTKLY